MTRRLLPEWADQSGVMLSWPHGHSDWAANLAAVENVFVEITRAVSRFEALLICACDDDHRRHIQAKLAEAGIPQDRVLLHPVNYNDTWVRDYGPIGVMENGQTALLDFTFNGWGNKYPAELDNAVNSTLHQAGAFGHTNLRTVPLVLEGGSIETDGQDGLLTTRRCLLSPERNPKLDEAAIEQTLKEQLGIERILWLDHGYLQGDDTDGHIDTLARFCDPHTITHVSCDDPEDEHYPEFQAMEQELRAFKQTNGEPYRLVPLPWPKACYDATGRRLPATYANFLIINQAVLVPSYRDPENDRRAMDALAACFPDREIIAIDCLPLIKQNGSLHCLTMQLTAGVLAT